MSTGPTASQQGEATNVEASVSLVREPVHFPRLELPPVPNFRTPVTRADELPVQQPMLDEPTGGWQYPYAQPVPTNSYSFQVDAPPAPPTSAPEPPAAPDYGFPRSAFARASAPAPAPVTQQQVAQVVAETPATPVLAAVAPAMPEPATPAPATPAPVAPAPAAPAPTPRATVPAMANVVPAAPEATTPAGDDVPTDVSKVALGLFLVTAVMLVWASRMAFSPALLAMAGLLVSEVAIALALVGPRSAKRSTGATVAAVAAIVVALLAAKGALAGFGEMAFVASLFVLVAALPTLLLLVVAEFALRRRSTPSPADLALRAGFQLRHIAVAALLASGFMAKDSFSAKPDTFVAFAIVALVAINVLHVLRGTGRAARA